MFYIVLVLISTVFIGIIYERICRRIEIVPLLSKMTFLSINGKNIHYIKEGYGNCTTVFISGLGSGCHIWQTIQKEIAHNCVTLSYDRSGLMFSDYDDSATVTNQSVSKELEQILEKTNCPKPYIVVAHSMASIYLRPFIQKHQTDIKAIVLVEGTHPKQLSLFPPELLKALKEPSYTIVRFLVETGIYRVIFSFTHLSPEISKNSPFHKMEKRFFYRSCKRIYDELRNDKINMADAANYDNWGDLPLTVIQGISEKRYATINSSTLKEEYKLIWNKLQNDLLNLSSNNKMVLAPDSGHLVQLGNPETIISAIHNYL